MTGTMRQPPGTSHPTTAAGDQPDALAAVVPSRQQYLDLKAQHPRAILLYRLGDFYEAFDDDALTVARDARITLTSRSFGRSGRVPMAGIPHHALNHYLGRLLAAGHTIAVAEQVSEPGRGLVERAVTRVLTPGTVAEPALLPPAENRYLAAVQALGDRLGLAWVDVSTGEFAVIEFAGAGAPARLHEELARLNPAECLIPDSGQWSVVSGQSSDQAPEPGGQSGGLNEQAPTTDVLLTTGSRPLTTDHWPLTTDHLTRLEHWHFAPEAAREALCRHFGTLALDAFGCAGLPAATGAAGAILAYLGRTNPALLPLLTGLRTETPDSRVGLDAATRRNLELTRGLRGGGARASLLGVLDQTRTAMGGRALRRMISLPRRDRAELERRQALVAGLVAAPVDRAGLAAALALAGDLERLTGRISQGLAGARDFLTLATALRAAATIGERLRGAGAPALVALAGAIDPCADVLELVEAAAVDGDNGPAIRPGFWPALDDALAGARDTRAWLTGLERAERERTGIRSLKVGFNKVFGYYIEVTRPNLSLVPDDYIRKQTVATGERYFTAALKEAEARLLAADEEIAALERAALAHLTARVTAAAGRQLATANRLAELDALLSLAELAARAGWVRPDLDDGDILEIAGGRHPVVEAGLQGEPFIPNDCRLGGDGPRLLLVTGPNMGGKSTYLRQVALIVLLAQIGSFVPAARARLGLVDRIFTRVGAQDDIAAGQSTFMVEMVETATILHQATRRSLVIVDEIGRGTGTDDGLAIARAVVEDLHDRLGARTLFATHYLELTALAGRLPGVANVHVAALEADGQVVFLHAVRPGPADRAYGIHVARLAGLPPWVAARAETLVASCQLPVASGGAEERRSGGAEGQTSDAPPDTQSSVLSPQSSSLATGDWQLTTDVARALAALDLEALTPRDALNWLFDQQARLRGGP